MTRRTGLAQRLLPLGVLALVLGGWEALVRIAEIPPYVLPSPSLVARTLVTDWGTLSASLWETLRITGIALALAVAIGVALAILFAQWRWLERSFFPFAVVLQVTPIIAIAPLLLVYLEPGTAVLVCAFLVAFFPILSNTALGLSATDRNLRDLFDLYGASRWQQMRLLRMPSALPYFPRRPADLGRARAHRRHRGRDRRRLGRARRGARVPHRRGGLPAQHPAHVRRPRADLGGGHRHLSGARPRVPPGAPPLGQRRESMIAVLSPQPRPFH